MKPILSLKEVNKNIGQDHIVKDLSFDINPGEIFGFLGPNGAGKTTTIRMIVGLTSVTSGSITINGWDISKNYKQAIAQVGAVVETPELYNYLTAEKNLIHFGRMSENVTKEDIKNRLDLVGLRGVRQQKVGKFSLGMKQRLGIAQALLHKPKLLVLDEPTNGLDPAGIREMRDHFRKIAQEEKIAIMISSHLLSEVELMCDRFAILQEGRMVKTEKISEDRDDKIGLYELEVDQINRATEILLKQFPQLSVNVTQEEKIQLRVTKEQLGEINALLVKEQIVLYQTTLVKQSLEERFLKATNQGGYR
ncbi:ABC transporter ATP-binding protein [Baia soyae]|uniref:ABC-2 type transport system ATP-binding protein n=1 Tax=Baia soyae TaxID=1544746 RepID=A0A4R2SBT7_9BACL|nr:ABC transporter ATP-binding protein [Baia soyae]TCP70218.1 ABC-2 type transport system ATP-binding protein [Baia soyae]